MLKVLKRVLPIRWELFHTTASVDQHFATLEKLRSSGIDFKTKGLNFGGGYGGAGGYSTVYHIYIRRGEKVETRVSNPSSPSPEKKENEKRA